MLKKQSENKKQILEMRILKVEIKNLIDGEKLYSQGIHSETEREREKKKSRPVTLKKM